MPTKYYFTFYSVKPANTALIALGMCWRTLPGKIPKSKVDGAGSFVQRGLGAEDFDAALAVREDLAAGQVEVIWRRTDDLVKIEFAEGVDHAPDAAPIDGAGAHGAGFGAGVKCAARQFRGRITLRRHPHQVGLGVAGAVMAGQHRVFRGQENLVIGVHQHSAEGMIAVFAGLPGHGDGGFEMGEVRIIHIATSIFVASWIHPVFSTHLA